MPLQLQIRPENLDGQFHVPGGHRFGNTAERRECVFLEHVESTLEPIQRVGYRTARPNEVGDQADDSRDNKADRGEDGGDDRSGRTERDTQTGHDGSGGTYHDTFETIGNLVVGYFKRRRQG